MIRATLIINGEEKKIDFYTTCERDVINEIWNTYGLSTVIQQLDLMEVE